MFIKGKSGGFIKAFGVVAPGAPQGTALQKNAGADSVTVMQTEFLNVEYDSCFHYVL